MYKIVYFDRMVFDNLEKRPKRGFTDEDYQTLKAAKYSGKIKIASSVPLIEETLPVVNSLEFASRARRTIEELKDRDFFIVDWQELLERDVRCYAHNSPLFSPFTNEFRHPERYITPPPYQIEDMKHRVDEVKQNKDEFEQGLKAAKDKANATLQGMPKAKRPTFEQYCHEFLPDSLESLAKRFEVLAKCQQRGIDGMLAINSVRAFIGFSSAIAYDVFLETCPADGHDLYDLQHSVMASAADIFVTEDTKFQARLARIPDLSYEVMGLGTLLDRIHAGYY